MQMLLIRHALPVRIEGAPGPADPPLSDLGRRQAERLAAWLADEPIDAVWCSPMRRARETAAPLAAALGHEVVIDDDLAEFDRDADTYIPMEELKAEGDPRWNAVVEGPWADDEHARSFESGVAGAMHRVVTANPGRTVAVVCHGGVINAFLADVLGLDDPLFFYPAYTGISRVLAARSGERSIETINEAAHLRDLS